MKAEKINEILHNIYLKDSTTVEEKLALLEACGCVWESKTNKVVDTESFMKMLSDHMGYRYDVNVESTENETLFSVKTFKKVIDEN